MPLVPEIKLHLAEDAVVFWARLEAEAKAKVATPFWASAWVGGQGLARYILDHPTVAMGKRVLDVASGSGLAAIAAAKAAAAKVTANDIDPYALAAITLNAKVNGVEIAGHLGDLLSGEGGDHDLVLAGDALYNAGMAEQVLPFLHRVIARGGEVLIGDPGRGYLLAGALEVVATYPTSPVGAFSDAQFDVVHVLKLSSGPNTQRPIAAR